MKTGLRLFSRLARLALVRRVQSVSSALEAKYPTPPTSRKRGQSARCGCKKPRWMVMGISTAALMAKRKKSSHSTGI